MNREELRHWYNTAMTNLWLLSTDPRVQHWLPRRIIGRFRVPLWRPSPDMVTRDEVRRMIRAERLRIVEILATHPYRGKLHMLTVGDLIEILADEEETR